VKILIGGVLCLHPLTSVIVFGWLMCVMRERTLAKWSGEKVSRWPGWFVGEGRLKLGALWRNVREGFAGVMNTWVLTLPGCGLWLFSWYDGWNNSFNKGYEQYWVGPLTGWLGVMLFILAMFYVPMGLARQAVTGQWRSFYDFALVRAVARERWVACLALAAGFALANVPVMLMKTAPVVFDRLPGYDRMTDAEVVAMVKRFYFFCGPVFFVLVMRLRVWAAGIYAGGVVGALHRGKVEARMLSEREREALESAGLMAGEVRPQRHVVLRWTIDMTGRAARWTGAVIVFVVWFTFVAQIFVSEFLNYHPLIGWLNQPLIQLPVVRYLP